MPWMQFFTHQVVDHGRLFSPVVKWAGRLETGALAPTMRKAIRTAVAERPGAVHLTVGGDVFSAPAPDEPVALPPLRAHALGVQVHGPGGDRPDPFARLATSRRPVILAGIGAVRAEATKEILALAETVGAPVVVSPMAKGVVPEDHPYFAGVLDMACNQVMWGWIEATDLVRLAESMDCDGVRVTTVAELERATERINDLDRPLVIEAVIDPSQYGSQF
jgi:acetolactate synthase I/II/III large subunit